MAQAARKNKSSDSVNKKSKPAPRKAAASPRVKPVIVDLKPEEYKSIPEKTPRPGKKLTLEQMNPQQRRMAQQKELGRIGGREKGTPNRTTTLLKVVAIGAIERLGYDGKGKDGALGWMMRQAKYNPEAYLKFLEKILPTQLNINDDRPKVYETLEDIVEGFKKRGLPVPPNLMKTINPRRHGEEPDDDDEPVLGSDD